MSYSDKVYSGTCATCGRELVQVHGEGGVIVETYHPAGPWDPDVKCASLLMIEGTRDWPEPAYSLRVPARVFILDKDAPVY